MVVIACDDEVLPSAERIETVSDDSDLQRGLQYGTTSSLRCLYQGTGFPAGDRRYAGVGVSGRFSGSMSPVAILQAPIEQSRRVARFNATHNLDSS